MRDDGVYAFPHSDDLPVRYSGMTLRDYFAGQVITGLFAAGIEIQSNGIKLHDVIQFAKLAYNVADAMILERDK